MQSYEEQTQFIVSLRATVAEQAGLIEQLSAEIAELRSRLTLLNNLGVEE